jgi:hypothetical protein
VSVSGGFGAGVSGARRSCRLVGVSEKTYIPGIAGCGRVELGRQLCSLCESCSTVWDTLGGEGRWPAGTAGSARPCFVRG